MGQAGIGIATNVLALLKAEGLSDADARRCIYTGDTPGLLCEDTPGLSTWQRAFARDRADVAGWKLDSTDRIALMDTVRNAKLTVLVGVTAQTGLFSAEVLSTMASYEPQPIILALSNPTSKCECTAADVAKATDGRGMFAAGSPFADIQWGDRTLVTSQCNNLYIFPGVGLGALVAKAPKVTHGMFLAASRALSDLVTPAQQAQGHLLPPMADIRGVSRAVAKAVAIEARDSGLGRLLDDDKYAEIIARAQWEPNYAHYRPGKAGG
jgi:malate dehydrogenase (oxaloacetate-decarboxylating)